MVYPYYVPIPNITDQNHMLHSSLQLRDYQKKSVSAVYDYWRTNSGNHPLLVLPTGAGKSAILSKIASDVAAKLRIRERHTHNRRQVLIVTHRAELLRQTARTLAPLLEDLHPQPTISSYGAALNSKNTNGDIVLAMVQSLARNPNIGIQAGLMIVDEAHLVAPNENTQYREIITTLQQNVPDVRILGLTATPYRTGQGWLWDGEDALFDGVAYEVPIKRLVEKGYLVEPVPYGGSGGEGLSEVSRSGTNGDYAIGQQDVVLEDAAPQIARQIVERGKDRRKWLVFCPGIGGVNHMYNQLVELGIECEQVIGTTQERNREDIYRRFRDPDSALRCIVGCDVLTTGFDAPITDLIALVRATTSPGLYVQVVGRGMRTFTNKSNCLILDYGKNVERHGPIDDVIPVGGKTGKGKKRAKQCKNCHYMNNMAALRCEYCDHEFERRERNSKISVGDGGLPILGGWYKYPILEYSWKVWKGKNGKPASICLEILPDISSKPNEIPKGLELYAGGHKAQKRLLKWYSPNGEYWPNTLANLRLSGKRMPIEKDPSILIHEAQTGQWKRPVTVSIEAPTENSIWPKVKRIKYSSERTPPVSPYSPNDGTIESLLENL